MKKIRLLLICEDDFKFNKIADLFSNSSFTVVGKTNDGFHGIKLIDELKPDLIVLGMILKGADGFAIIKHVSAKKYECKTVVVSAVKNERVIRKAFSYGADYYIATPVSENVLIGMLETFYAESAENSSIIKKTFNVNLNENPRETSNEKAFYRLFSFYGNDDYLNWRYGWRKPSPPKKDED